MDVLYVILGLALLVAGGESLIRGAVKLAERLGISPLLIGLTLVGFGTSTPELVTSVQAALRGSEGIAIGNVVGSNIANILFILGVAGLIAPIACGRATLRRDGSVMAAATLLAIGMALLGVLGRGAGLLLVLLLIGYMLYAYVSDRRENPHADRMPDIPKPPLARNIAFALAGLALTVVGAWVLVEGAVGLARTFGISETVIGLTIVAVGTSLPELVASVVAAFRRHTEVAFGNIVGSNIYNLLGILGVTALIKPLTVPTQILELDLWVMFVATALLMLFSITGNRLTRLEAGVLLALYGAYLGFLGATAGMA